MSSATPREIRVHIDRLVVGRGVCRPSDVEALQLAVAAELGRLFAGDGQTDATTGDRKLPSLPARIAADVYRSMVRE
jgi:hypothetical protein